MATHHLLAYTCFFDTVIPSRAVAIYPSDRAHQRYPPAASADGAFKTPSRVHIMEFLNLKPPIHQRALSPRAKVHAPRYILLQRTHERVHFPTVPPPQRAQRPGLVILRNPNIGKINNLLPLEIQPAEELLYCIRIRL